MKPPRDTDQRAAARALRDVHERFVTGEVDVSALESSDIRPVVARSWQRSRAKGVDPDIGGRSAVQRGDERGEPGNLRDTHPLAPALPIIRRLLVDDAVDSGVVVAVTAADGTLLWVEGDPVARGKAEKMNFAPGADWSERSAGTNAPGTALALDREIQILGSEHFSRIVQPWSCTAAPVHDPDSGALLGAIDLTGGAEVAICADVGAGPRHRRRRREPSGAAAADRPAPEPAVRRPHLVVLGGDRPRWVTTDTVRPSARRPPHGSARRHPGSAEQAPGGSAAPTTWPCCSTTRTSTWSRCARRCRGCGG